MARMATGAAAPGWTFDGWVVGPLLVSLAWYALRLPATARGARRWRRRTARAPAGSSPAGLVLAAALVTPLHEAGERSFAAHMLEHELLMLVAAPLLVLSRPIGIALVGLAARRASRAGRVRARASARRGAR